MNPCGRVAGMGCSNLSALNNVKVGGRSVWSCPRPRPAQRCPLTSLLPYPLQVVLAIDVDCEYYVVQELVQWNFFGERGPKGWRRPCLPLTYELRPASHASRVYARWTRTPLPAPQQACTTAMWSSCRCRASTASHRRGRRGPWRGGSYQREALPACSTRLACSTRQPPANRPPTACQPPANRRTCARATWRTSRARRG
jgi:hypothetical protein